MAPTIKTGSWVQPLPPGHVRFSISRSVPRGTSAGFRSFRQLAPGPWFRSVPDPVEWTARYEVEMLSLLDPADVLRQIGALAGDQVAVLTCWEPPPPNRAWCHRALVSVWLHETLGLPVPELGHEHLGFGRRHPKLHPKLMRPPGA